jgi:hypothetical protein
MKQTEMMEAALSVYGPDQAQGDSLHVLVPGDEFLQNTVDRFPETRMESHPALVACYYDVMDVEQGVNFLHWELASKGNLRNSAQVSESSFMSVKAAHAS